MSEAQRRDPGINRVKINNANPRLHIAGPARTQQMNQLQECAAHEKGLQRLPFLCHLRTKALQAKGIINYVGCFFAEMELETFT